MGDLNFLIYCFQSKLSISLFSFHIHWIRMEQYFFLCIGDVNEYDVYEIEYEPEGATSDEEQYESSSNKKRGGNSKAKKVCNSSGESDIDDILMLHV